MLMRSQSLQRQDGQSGGRNKPNSSQKPRVSTPVIGRGVRSWGVKKWLSQSSSSPQQSQRSTRSYRLDSGFSVSPPLRERQLLKLHKQTPAMTLVLKKLREFLPSFCQAMAECQFVKCCSMLGTAMTLTLVPPVDQSSPSPPPMFSRSSSPTAKSSPSRSPIRAWLGGGGMESSVNDSTSYVEETDAAAVLESKMEVFFLLVGVESMYQSLAHSISPRFAQLLVSCYEQTVKDMQLLRLTLCDAFLVSHQQGSGSAGLSSESGTSRFLAENVSSLASSLLLLISFCQARIQCVQLQSALWQQAAHRSSQPTFADMAALFESIVPNLLASSQEHAKASTSSLPAAVESLSAAIVNEIGAWSGLCQTAFSVQGGRFAESILGSQSTKMKIVKLQKIKAENKKPSCLELWLQDSLKAMVGTFPIVFDKVSAFAKPLYGFEEEMEVQASVNATESSLVFRNNVTADAFETDVMEALRKYEKLGAFSVAVVVDAVRTSNVGFESGFCPVERPLPDTTVDPEAAVRQRYPAIYIRTLSPAVVPTSPGPPRSSLPITFGPPSPTETAPGGLLLASHGGRKENCRKDRLKRTGSRSYDVEDNVSTSSPQTNSGRKLLRSWSTEDSSVQGSLATSHRNHQKVTSTLEYGSEEGQECAHVSWPHSEWAALVNAISEISEDSENLRNDTSLYNSNNNRLQPPNLDMRPPSPGPRISYGHQTLYCIESVSDSMWLVVIMKNLEVPTSGWQWQTPRPTTERVEDNLRDLVSHLASMVRVSDRFQGSLVQAFRDKSLEKSSDEFGAGLAEELKERGFEAGGIREDGIREDGIFRLIKNQLKVLAQVDSPDAPSGSSLPTRSRLLRRSRRGKMSNRLAGHAESAAALFLGRELMHAIAFD